jgi:hypothetical protein
MGIDTRFLGQNAEKKLRRESRFLRMTTKKSKGNSRSPSGMTTRKATARTTATVNAGVLRCAQNDKQTKGSDNMKSKGNRFVRNYFAGLAACM